MRGLQRAAPAPRRCRGGRAAQAEGPDPLRRTGVGLRRRGSATRPSAARARDSGAGHLLRHAALAPSSGQGAEGAEPGRSSHRPGPRAPAWLARRPRHCRMSHRDTVFARHLASGARPSTEPPAAAFESEEQGSTASSSTRRSHTPYGQDVLKRFLATPAAARCRGRRPDRRGADRRTRTRWRRCHLRLSGGVDSSVAALPVHGDRRSPRASSSTTGWMRTRASSHLAFRDTSSPARGRRRRVALPRQAARRPEPERASARSLAPSSSASRGEARRSATALAGTLY